MDCKQGAAEHTWIEVLDPEPEEPQFAICWRCGLVGMVVPAATAEVQALAS
jgi:hypothetical protein